MGTDISPEIGKTAAPESECLRELRVDCLDVVGFFQLVADELNAFFIAIHFRDEKERLVLPFHITPPVLSEAYFLDGVVSQHADNSTQHDLLDLCVAQLVFSER